MVILEVMANNFDRMWWIKFRRALERKFRQDEIVIRAQDISRIQIMCELDADASVNLFILNRVSGELLVTDTLTGEPPPARPIASRHSGRRVL
jgi:hypothetical protein